MKDIITSLFGVYTPITYNNGSYDIIPDGLAGVDITFVCGVLLFAISFYCVFRIVGAIIKNVICR